MNTVMSTVNPQKREKHKRQYVDEQRLGLGRPAVHLPTHVPVRGNDVRKLRIDDKVGNEAHKTQGQKRKPAPAAYGIDVLLHFSDSFFGASS